MGPSLMETLFGTENYTLAKTLLDAAELRHQALSSNLANAETPGYRRVDLSVDFEKELQQAVRKGGGAEAIAQVRPSIEHDPSAQAMRADGNNVSIENELLQINRNTMEYEYLSRYVSDSIKGLKRAITGRNI
ncbi:MAG: flagellar basal body rod protein FlgB [Opitutales bacterium]